MKKEKNLKITPYLYLVPSILIFAVFLFYPFVKTVYLSLFMTNKMGQAKIFVGLQNYIDLLSSESFRNSLKVTLAFVDIKSEKLIYNSDCRMEHDLENHGCRA